MGCCEEVIRIGKTCLRSDICGTNAMQRTMLPNGVLKKSITTVKDGTYMTCVCVHMLQLADVEI